MLIAILIAIIQLQSWTAWNITASEDLDISGGIPAGDQMRIQDIRVKNCANYRIVTLVEWRNALPGWEEIIPANDAYTIPSGLEIKITIHAHCEHEGKPHGSDGEVMVYDIL